VSHLLTTEPQRDGAKFLIVDDNAEVRSLLRRGLSSMAVGCAECSTAPEALQWIAHNRCSVVLCDIMMPGMSGLELLRHIRRNDPLTSVIMITGVHELTTAVEALRLGACDYITKPFDLLQVRRSVARAQERNQLLRENDRHQQELEHKVAERTRELHRALAEVEESYRVTLNALVAALDAREHETQSHSQRVCAYAETLARRLGLGGDDLVEIGRGALLHDVGKIGVPDSILLKPSSLSEAEWMVMRRHPSIGYDILRNIRFLVPAAEIVLAHQERWDGQGYPHGLAGTEIPVGARIFAVVDTLDAMTSDRPYRKGQSFDAAIREIRRCAGTQFDPWIVEGFLSMPPESWPELHDAVNRVHGKALPPDLLCRTSSSNLLHRQTWLPSRV